MTMQVQHQVTWGEAEGGVDSSDFRLSLLYVRVSESPHPSPRPVACLKEGDEKKIPDVVLIWYWGLKTDLFRGK